LNRVLAVGLTLLLGGCVATPRLTTPAKPVPDLRGTGHGGAAADAPPPSHPTAAGEPGIYRRAGPAAAEAAADQSDVLPSLSGGCRRRQAEFL